MEDCGKNGLCGKMTYLVEECVISAISQRAQMVYSPSRGFTGAFVYSRGIPLRVPSGLGRVPSPMESSIAAYVDTYWTSLADALLDSLTYSPHPPFQKLPKITAHFER